MAARAGLAKELERSTALGVGGVCFHPGAAIGSDCQAAASRVAEAITEALERVQGNTRLWVENTAGAGTTIGRTAEEIGAILDGVPQRLRARTGYGLDTCHLFSSGHDITKSETELRTILDAFESANWPPTLCPPKMHSSLKDTVDGLNEGLLPSRLQFLRQDNDTVVGWHLTSV